MGLVKNPADIYDLTDDKLTIVGRIGELTSRRILRGIEASKKVPFERVLFALSIPNVGETTAKKIALALESIEAIMVADVECLTAIDEIGEVIAESVVAFFNNEANVEMVNRLKRAGVQMAINEEVKVGQTNKLAGKSIVISGVFALHSRDEYKEIITR